MYLVPLADNIVSIVRPADRKFVGQWLKKDRSNVISDYLQQSIKTIADRQAVTIAIDLEDVMSAGVIAERIKSSKAVQGKNIEAIAASIASLKGINISVPENSLQATVLLDFHTPIGDLLGISKALLGKSCPLGVSI